MNWHKLQALTWGLIIHILHQLGPKIEHNCCLSLYHCHLWSAALNPLPWSHPKAMIRMLDRVASLNDCTDCHWPLVLLQRAVAVFAVWAPVTLITSSALGWNPEAGVQLTPIESVISQDCQVWDAPAAQEEPMLIRHSSSVLLFDFSSHSSPPPLTPFCSAGRV